MASSFTVRLLNLLRVGVRATGVIVASGAVVGAIAGTAGGTVAGTTGGCKAGCGMVAGYAGRTF